MKTANPPIPSRVKQVDWDVELTDEEKILDQQAYDWMPHTWPQRQAHQDMVREAANNTLARLEKERVAISVKVPKTTLAKFKQVAENEWLKYQTFLNRLIFLAAEGKLTYGWKN